MVICKRTFLMTVLPSVFLTAFLATSVFASNTEFSINLNNPLETTATAKGYFLTLFTEGGVNLEILPSPQGQTATKAENLTVLTNAPTGYKLYISSDKSTDYDATHPGNGLYLNGVSTSDFIGPTTTTTLDNNSWGYGMTNSSFSAVPLKTNPVLVKSTSVPDQTPGTTNTAVPVYYGAKVTTAIPSGVYTGKVLYSVFADAATSEEATVTPSSTTNFAGGDSVRISTSLFGIGEVSDVSVTVGGDTCTVTDTDTDDDVFSVTCTLPAKPVLQRSYDIVVSVPKYGKTYTITDGISYEYVGFPSTLTTMQGMTPEICASVTTPAAFNEDGTVNANVAQSTLSDIRDSNTYTVRKLADGNCWMTENLRLGTYGRSITLTSANSDVSSSYTINSTSIDNSDGTNWSNSPGVTHVYNRNNSYGNLYNWYTATASTGTTTMTSQNAPSSVCPKQWKLPPSSTLYNLITNTYLITDNLTSIMQEPFSILKSGFYDNSQHYSEGDSGHYWTSSATDDSNSAYGFGIGSNLYISYPYKKAYGFAVRCLASN